MSQEIIEKYYLKPGSELVHYEVRTKAVDCWFDTDKYRQHRVVSFEDFKKHLSIL